MTFQEWFESLPAGTFYDDFRFAPNGLGVPPGWTLVHGQTPIVNETPVTLPNTFYPYGGKELVFDNGGGFFDHTGLTFDAVGEPDYVDILMRLRVSREFSWLERSLLPGTEGTYCDAPGTAGWRVALCGITTGTAQFDFSRVFGGPGAFIRAQGGELYGTGLRGTNNGGSSHCNWLCGLGPLHPRFVPANTSRREQYISLIQRLPGTSDFGHKIRLKTPWMLTAMGQGGRFAGGPLATSTDCSFEHPDGIKAEVVHYHYMRVQFDATETITRGYIRVKYTWFNEEMKFLHGISSFFPLSNMGIAQALNGGGAGILHTYHPAQTNVIGGFSRNLTLIDYVSFSIIPGIDPPVPPEELKLECIVEDAEVGVPYSQRLVEPGLFENE